MFNGRFKGLRPSQFTPPGKAVGFLVLSWIIWLTATFLSFTVPSEPAHPRVFWGLIVLPAVVFIIALAWEGVITLSDRNRAPNQQNGTPGQQNKPRRLHSRNLLNTVITLLVTIIIIPALYHGLWYQDRTREVIEISQDTVDKILFPSITVFQRSDWTSQANLDASVDGKCFIGWHDEKAPDCSEVPPGTTPCQCGGSWAEQVVDFKWHNASYRAVTLTSTSSMLSLSPTTLMIAQTFFTYNTEKARNDSSRVLSPSLFLAVYDPHLTLEQALENGFTRMNLINANGMAAINLGLSYRKYTNKPYAYDYTVSISTVPATEIQCDPSSGDEQRCFLSLFLQFPTFDRLVFTQSVAMSDEELISAAGSWFAVSQLGGWILSGMALKPE